MKKRHQIIQAGMEDTAEEATKEENLFTAETARLESAGMNV